MCQLLLAGNVVGNSKTLAAFRTATGKDLAAIGGSHTFTEAVFVDSLAV